jgi:Kef-type K+ transport system membrane component KefB
MNTRGLMELIALNIGLDMKVISPTLFAMMVLMAIATTMAASPLLQLLPPATETERQSSPMTPG